jgi:ABC-type nickel/cobalt efflux system permease component RcnA
MLITRKSHRPSDDSPFRSRFREPGSGAFALRQFLRCREEFYQRIVVTVVQGCFAVVLVMFGRTLHRMFQSHGQDLPVWVELICQGLLLGIVLLILRRVVRNARGIRSLREEMRRLRREVDDLRRQS